MVRFSTSQDPGFVSIAGELQRWVHEVRIVPAQGETELPPQTEKDEGSDGLPCQETSIRRQGITILGSVTKSSVVNGSQVISGSLIMG